MKKDLGSSSVNFFYIAIHSHVDLNLFEHHGKTEVLLKHQSPNCTAVIIRKGQLHSRLVLRIFCTETSRGRTGLLMHYQHFLTSFQPDTLLPVDQAKVNSDALRQKPRQDISALPKKSLRLSWTEPHPSN